MGLLAQRHGIIVAATLGTLCLGLGAAAVGNGDADDPVLLAFEEWISVAMPSEGAGSYGALYIGDLCTSVPGAVKIIGVEPHKPTGALQVTDFSVYTLSPKIMGAVENTRLRDVPGYRAGGDIVNVECTAHNTPPAQGIAIETYKPTTADVWAEGFVVTYESDDEEKEVLMHWALRLCDDFDAPECEPP